MPAVSNVRCPLHAATVDNQMLSSMLSTCQTSREKDPPMTNLLRSHYILRLSLSLISLILLPLSTAACASQLDSERVGELERKVAALDSQVRDLTRQLERALSSSAGNNHSHLEYADAVHSHSDDGLHSHTEYARQRHSHTEYAESFHSHFGTDAHSHLEYASRTHSHFDVDSHFHFEYANRTHSHSDSHAHSCTSIGSFITCR